MKKRYRKLRYRETAFYARRVARTRAVFTIMKAAAIAQAHAISSSLTYDRWVPVSAKAAAQAGLLVNMAGTMSQIDQRQAEAIARL